jgi:hypothetical protein
LYNFQRCKGERTTGGQREEEGARKGGGKEGEGGGKDDRKTQVYWSILLFIQGLTLKNLRHKSSSTLPKYTCSVSVYRSIMIFFYCRL